MAADQAPATAEQVAQGGKVTGFGCELLRRLPTGDNLVVSPLSVWLCLATLVPGARGRTLRALTQVMGMGEGGEAADFAKAAGALMRCLSSKEVFTLAIANALWAAEGHPFHEAYVKALVEDLAAHPASVDFGDASATADRINAWVAEKTGGRIDGLMSASAISPTTRLLLTNATYFKAAWGDQFQESRTEPAVFHAPAGPVRVPMMRGEVERRHVVDPALGLHAVSLPYDAMHAVVILPDDGAWDRVREAMSGELVDLLVAGMREKIVDLHLPRFHIDEGLEITDHLAAMGLADVFGPEADLGGISPRPEPLWVSSVVHRADITVDEHGTEAAAATALETLGAALQPEEPERVTMRVDRPFLFLVRDPETGTVLFLARVMDPSA